MSDLDTSPKIYVACLASYNNGTLHGAWIDATDADAMREAIAAMLRTSPYPNVTVPCPVCCGVVAGETCAECGGAGRVPSAEEYAIHDYDGFFGLSSTLGEYPSLDDVAHVAAMLEEHGEAWALWADHIGDLSLTSDDFHDAYCGEYDSKVAYAEYLTDECGLLDKVPENLRYYFDFDAYARDLFMDGYTFLDGHVFNG